MVVILACVFAACDKTDAQETNYKVTIHPNNGQADFVWEIKTDIPVITYYGYHVVGYYLDEDFTTSTTLESLKSTELTKNIDVYVKWEKDSVPPKTRITTNNLNCDIDNRLISGKVSNDTTMFSFIDEISVEKGTTYTISTDINGINTIPSKTVNLEIGDNVFYILVQNGEELTLYTATVRRKPIYTVAFDTKGGTEVQSQQVEEDGFATAPTTEKNGCTFDKWDWDFSMPITENTTITAIWNAFVYNIVYDFNIPEDSVSQEVDNSMNPTTYTVDDTIYFSAPARKGYYLTGWSVSSISKGTTGTVTTTAQWRPIIYEIVYDFGDANSVSKATNNDSNPRYYCVENEITFAEPTRAGYSFVSWDKNIEKGTTGTQTVTASWDVNQYNIEYVLNGWTNAENNKTIYTIEDKTFALSDGMNGESLFCGWYLDNEYTNCIETIDASTMIDYTIYAMPDCGATKGLSIENGVVKGYSGASNEVIIPSFYKGYAVDSLVESAFKNCVGIVSVEIPDSVKSIEQGAFSGCSSLENITIPFVGAKAGVTSDDKYQYPFGYIFGTSSYDGGVATRQDYYRNDTSSPTSTTYYIPSSLKSVTVTGGNILYGAFYGCESIASATISDSVTSVGSSAFSGCNLTKISGPSDAVSVITKQCNSKAVEEIVITSGTSICDSAFRDCSGLTSVTIPNSVTSIGDSAFRECTGFTSVTIPDSVANIGNSAFEGCRGLTSVSLGNGVISIGDSAFYDCGKLTSITIPHGVESIGNYAFLACRRLIEVHNKSSLTIIAGSSDNGHVASSAKNVYTDTEGESKLSTENDYVVYTDGTEKILVDYTGTKTELTLPSYITQINDWAFSNCAELTSVTIPNSVRSIGSHAFSGCSGLTMVAIGNGVTSIGWQAFDSCIGLTSLTIGKNVTDIGSNAFIGCTGLTSVIVDNENTKYHSAGNCLIETATKTLILGCKTSAIPSDGTVTSIGNSAFCYCSDLTSITIPDSVTNIGYGAFRGCSGLTNISFEGTKEQWNAITKGDNWNDGVATDCTITCSDGTI